jgi:hypothetical protein
MRVRWSPPVAAAALAGAAVLVWAARTRPAVVRAALIRVAVVVEDVVRIGQIALLRVSRRSTTPLLIVGHGSPQRWSWARGAQPGGAGLARPRRTAGLPPARDLVQSPPAAPVARSCARAWRAF